MPTRETLRERVHAIRELERRYGRPIGILVDLQGPKLRVGAFGGDSAMLVKGENFTFDGDTSPGERPAGAPAPSRGHGGSGGRRRGPHRRRQAAPQGHRRAAGPVTTEVQVGGKISNRKGFNLPDTDHSGRGDDREGPLRSRGRARRRRRLDRALLRAAPRGHRRGAQDDARARARHDQAREAAGAGPPRRDHGGVRRRHGGARRSRRRDAAREGAGHAEAHHPRLRAGSASRSWSRRRCWNR